MDTVSVIIPTYNRKKLLSRAINSVCTQTFSDWELLVVDDGSTDDTALYMSGLSDKRIKYLPQKKNLGVAHARNVGISNAKGRYIALLDSDDEWYPDKLAMQIELFNKVDIPNLGIVGCFREDVDEDGQTIHISNKVYEGDVLNDFLANWMVRYDIINSSIALIKAEVLYKIGVFDERLKDHEDYDLWVRIADQYNFATVPKSLARCYKWKKEARMSTTQYLENKLTFFRKHESTFTKHPDIYSEKCTWIARFALEAKSYSISHEFFIKAISVSKISFYKRIMYFFEFFIVLISPNLYYGVRKMFKK